MSEQRRRLRAVVTGTAVLAVLAAPTVASAATARLDGGVLRIEALPGEVNHVNLGAAGVGIDGPTLRVASNGLEPGEGCFRLGGSSVGCPRDGITQIVATLGDRDDSFDGGGIEIPMVLDGGDGRDELEGGEAGDELRGGPGRDTLAGGSRLGGDPVANVLDGGLGDDVFLLSASRRDADDVRGGDGLDTARYDASGVPVVADLDGVADDGDPDAGGVGVGEDDNLRPDVEVVRGSRDDDVLTGSAGGQTLDGGDGDDTLLGLEGDDRLIGGAGLDTLHGGADNDTLELRDGREDGCSTSGPRTPPGVDVVDADAVDTSDLHRYLCFLRTVRPVVVVPPVGPILP